MLYKNISYCANTFFKNKAAAGMFFVLSLAFLTYVTFTVKAEEGNASKKNVDNLVYKLKKKEITKIEIYYYDQSIESWADLNITENDLLSKKYNVLVALLSSKICCSKAIGDFSSELEKFNLYESTEKRQMDHRLGYIFYSNNIEISRIFLFPEPVIEINGKYYYCSIGILRSLIQLLPKEDTEEIYERIINGWQKPYRLKMIQEFDPQAYEKLYGGKIKDSNEAK
jgi:hypothetical protein